ncbi:hypothetical protein CDEST_15419 [Colletotrichum destructivum]|uniref:Uncharacterized protein n=1 Tax=Colletotrichum destructivum TaxID=34406 RepID=A0AAX4J4S9_9PEZI|nr:hypothetical protein CDEST_15419 [Colletotrichum destructivum]
MQTLTSCFQIPHFALQPHLLLAPTKCGSRFSTNVHMCLGSVEVLCLLRWFLLPTVSPQCSALSGLRLDPILPKDLGLFYEPDCLGGCFALVQYDPEIVSSWEGSELLASDLPIFAASQQDVRYRLSSLPALAVGAGNVWHSSAEEKILESDLFRARLDQERTLWIEK